MTSFFASVLGKVITGLVVLATVLGFYIWFTWDSGAQPKQDARSANATAETAIEAAEVAIERSGEDASIDRLVENTAKLIDTLPPPEAAKAARSAICSMSEYKDDPKCSK